jgi:XTP/dITP diphosphohydrolase
MRTMFLASSNKNKIREISLPLKSMAINLKSLEDVALESPDESGKTFEENALLKADFGFEKTGLPTIADDSGFCIESLRGFPGIFSGRFAEKNGGYQRTMRLLNELLKNENKKSYFIAVIAFIDRNSSGKMEKHIFRGRVDGNFVYPPRGNNGFGYCPCFMPDGSGITYGEMDNERRMESNHRSVALNKFIEFIRKRETTNNP